MKHYLAVICSLFSFAVFSKPFPVPDVAGPLPVPATYTIGGANPDFATITQAVEFLNGGISQPTTFLIRAGTYSEKISIGSITGSSEVNTIVFKSENGDPTSVIVTHATSTLENSYVWRLQSCNYITIRDITIKPTGSEYAAGMVLEGTMHKLRIINNIFDTPEVPPFYTNGYGYGIWGFPDAYLYASRISENKFYNGHYGFIFHGSTIAVNFPTVPADSVINNHFTDQRSDAIHGYYGNNFLFANNTIVSKHNYSRAFFIVDTNNSVIRENDIHVKGDGIRLGSLNNCQLINNFVNIDDIPGSTNSQKGISISGSGNKLFFNTVVMREDSPDAMAASVSMSGTSLGEVKNNIFYNLGEGIAVSFSSQNVAPTTFVSDHNDIYTPMTKLLTWSDFFSVQHHAYTLFDWTTFSGQDAHSISMDPELVSSTDLHAQSPALIGAGTPLTVTTDIDGNQRHATLPTIGADEFGTVRYNDVKIVSIYEFGICEEPRGFTIIIQNNAVEKITSLQLDWTINGVSQPPIQWTGEIARNYQEFINLPELPSPTSGSITISAFINTINGTADENPLDNEAGKTVTFYSPVELGDYEQLFCESQDIVLSVPEGYSYYEWSNENNDEWAIVSNETAIVASAPGKYGITVFDLNGCVWGDTVNIRFEDLTPFALAPNGTTICSSKAVNLNAFSNSSAVTYQWLKNSEIIAGATSQMLQVDQTGTYEVKVSSAHCSDVSAPLIIVAAEAPVKPQITIMGDLTLCPTEVVKLAVSPIAQNNTYQWVKDGLNLPGKTAAELETSTKGSYKVRAIKGGCTAESDIAEVRQLDRPAKPSVTGPSELCDGSEIMLSAPLGFKDYLWSTGEKTQSIKTTKGGSYSVIVSEVCSSLPSENKTVVVKSLPTAVLEFDLGLLTVSKGDAYQWYFDDTLIAGETKQSHAPQKEGTYQAEVKVGNCSAMSNTVTIIIMDVKETADSEISFYPNPVERYLTVNIPSHLTTGCTVRLLNALGMMNAPLNMTPADNGFLIDLDGFSAGLYWLEIQTTRGRYLRKVVVK